MSLEVVDSNTKDVENPESRKEKGSVKIFDVLKPSVGYLSINQQKQVILKGNISIVK